MKIALTRLPRVLLLVCLVVIASFAEAANNKKSVPAPGFYRVADVPLISPSAYDKKIAKRNVSSKINKSIKPVSSQAGIISRSISYLDAPEMRGSDPAPASIAELARSLKYDPDLIYQYVHDNVRYYPIWGVQKGALGALIDGHGTAFDQASLMVELLKATPGNPYQPKYILGDLTVEPVGLANSVGMNLSASNGGLSGGQLTLNAAKGLCGILTVGGIPASGFNNSDCGSITDVPTSVVMKHIWVSAVIDGTTYYFDPALKTFAYTSTSTELSSWMGTHFNESTYLTNSLAGATSTGTPINTITNINRTGVRDDLDSKAESFIDHLRDNLPDATLDDVIGDLSPNFRTMTKMRFPVNLKQRRSRYEETIHRRTNHQSYSTA